MQDHLPDDVTNDDLAHHTAEAISDESFAVETNGIHLQAIIILI